MVNEVRDLLGRGLKPVEVAKKLGISRATVYRYRCG
ncbi:helix-turn-helix domain-containing protein [Paraglaciecola arctica]|nr:helix-turn-helix domain-containing protein [Paraglaciecola arctica]